MPGQDVGAGREIAVWIRAGLAGIRDDLEHGQASIADLLQRGSRLSAGVMDDGHRCGGYTISSKFR